jgi:hypothetical protein
MLLLRIAQVLVGCLGVALVCLLLTRRKRPWDPPYGTDWKFVRRALLFIGAVILVVAYILWLNP